MEIGIIFILFGIFLFAYDTLKRPRERLRQDSDASSRPYSRRSTRLPVGIIYIAIGAFFLIEPYNHSLANWVLWLGILFAIAIWRAYDSTFAKWQDWLIEKLGGKDKADDRNDSKEEK